MPCHEQGRVFCVTIKTSGEHVNSLAIEYAISHLYPAMELEVVELYTKTVAKQGEPLMKFLTDMEIGEMKRNFPIMTVIEVNAAFYRLIDEVRAYRDEVQRLTESLNPQPPEKSPRETNHDRNPIYAQAQKRIGYGDITLRRVECEGVYYAVVEIEYKGRFLEILRQATDYYFYDSITSVGIEAVMDHSERLL